MPVQKRILKGIINRLLHAIEEEDIGISLLTTQYQDEEQLQFFSEEDSDRVIKILSRLSQDSVGHRKALIKILDLLEKKVDEP